jgi:hypothetical protein
MSRHEKNFFIDAIAFIGFVLLTNTGILMRYILPPGSGRWKVIWGLDRHEWGSIHFWISIIFFSVLTIHLILHWRWILTFIKRRPREGSGLRAGLGIVGLVGLIALAIAPLVSTVETTAVKEKGVHMSKKLEDIQIFGSMTLNEVEQNTGVPAEYITQELKLPPDTDRDERLGRLKKMFGFTMEDVRTIVRNYEKEQ